jgi:quinol-cytochrome oxidoreductase complex cytochrome b subunit
MPFCHFGVVRILILIGIAVMLSNFLKHDETPPKEEEKETQQLSPYKRKNNM